MKKNTPTSDPIYKRLYAFVEMVADLLRSVVPKATLEALDLRTLEKVPAEYVGDHFQQRHGDTVWRVRAGGPDSAWAYVLVLLEFQSSSDATMALRVNEYTVMLYRELLRAKRWSPANWPTAAGAARGALQRRIMLDGGGQRARSDRLDRPDRHGAGRLPAVATLPAA